jgi:branched-chain amino acid transport system ATP-binding protein
LAPSESADHRAIPIAAEPLLAVAGLDAGYGKKRVLDGVDLTVDRGEAIALLGHNGAGKTTLLQAVFGLQPLWQGRLSFAGRPLGGHHSARAAVALGMALIPAERFVFPDLTVLENLRLGVRGLSGAESARRIDAAYVDFPVLHERANQLAGSMSGGEQRMVSLAMAMMRKPALLLLDEPSLGLSPAIAEQMMTRVRRLVAQGVSVVLVEQNIAAALSVASRIYVLRSGRMILTETAPAFAARGRENWWDLF